MMKGSKVSDFLAGLTATALFLIVICFVIVLLTLHRPRNLSEQEQLQKNKPVKNAVVDDVTLWKVRDTTSGDWSYIYFTTPAGSIATP